MQIVLYLLGKSWYNVWHLEIQFKNRKMRKLCEDGSVAMRQLGRDSAKQLRARLSDLEAAKNVAELVAGNPHPLKGERAGQFALNLAGGQRLVFLPAAKPVPTKADGGIDWSQVESICIKYIGDYHG